MAATTMEQPIINNEGCLPRLDDEDYEQEFSAPLALAMGTGTPRTGMNEEEADAIQEAARRAMWAFSQAAK